MTISLSRFVKYVAVALLSVLPTASAWAQAPSDFHWVDLEKDDWNVGLIKKALQREHLTAIRDIGLIGDAALVFTADRAHPDGIPDNDTITVYSISLRALLPQKIVSGYRMSVIGWSKMIIDHRAELATTYVDCIQCEATTYFTTFYFDGKTDTWRARWMSNQHGVALSSSHVNEDYTIQPIYAMLTEQNGQDALVTWSHYQYSNSKKTDDYLYEYDVDPGTDLDRVQRFSGNEATSMKLRLCQVDPSWAYLHHGQDLPVCQALVQTANRPTRRIVTTPPKQNEGRSQPR